MSERMGLHQIISEMIVLLIKHLIKPSLSILCSFFYLSGRPLPVSFKNYMSVFALGLRLLRYVIIAIIYKKAVF